MVKKSKLRKLNKLPLKYRSCELKQTNKLKCLHPPLSPWRIKIKNNKFITESYSSNPMTRWLYINAWEFKFSYKQKLYTKNVTADYIVKSSHFQCSPVLFLLSIWKNSSKLIALHSCSMRRHWGALKSWLSTRKNV